MSIHPNITALTALLAEKSRATILAALMDGKFHTASELAYMATIKPQTASFHLAKLVENNLVISEKNGRFRYFRLANEEVANTLEIFMSISPPPEVRSLKQSSQLKRLENARTCYDHLAGRLSVTLTNIMQEEGYIEKSNKRFIITTKGEHFFKELGIDLIALSRKRRSFCHACLDWSERTHHLGGALGNGLFERYIELGWLESRENSREIVITTEGKSGFKEFFGLSI
ncbi:ArsR/SmtB family transcription factor [Cytobacillus kochii]|uniref:ArsR/SmtB family transcription factor n=1 Tax=Cytobacillus kochii TaxID=859143 RepID=UPI001CD38795|nr:metalloregulator ArsR/SmtB family transcription factor [Cytobacillus kochii]MCA1026252.1 helix-turn-helix domain-containing protein [Cytobacillus kochii]MCM3322586.1 helix-turn-helix domain-containing protein [Cytobacillus kochii]MCM3344935.1 helix-turn-helix domain-containing protein [Cytobacillus kochii]